MADLPSLNIEELSFVVCDNDVNMSSMVVSMLHTLGVKKLREAHKGSEAMKMLEERAPDIFVCEWDTGDMTGVELVRQIRFDEDHPARMVAVIFLTAHTKQGQVAQSRDAGITEFLAKPVSAATLYKRICSVILNPRAFVIADSFVGPDRRRQFDLVQVEQGRREADQMVPDMGASGAGVDDNELMKMLGL